MQKRNQEKWLKTTPQIFWAEVAPCEHVVQIYENDQVVMDSLFEFVQSGFNMGESIVIIATDEHIKELDQRLEARSFDIRELVAAGKYICRNANLVLSKFMVNDWPDEERFNYTITEIISTANRNNSKVRAFGEMVAILWAEGYSGATVRLEYLWNKFCKTQAFSLFCAYPASGFTQDIKNSINHICSHHSKVISGAVQTTDNVVLYRNY